MTRFIRATALGITLFLPIVANAAMWEFAGGLNIEQSVAAGATTVPVPYFGGGFVMATLDDVSGEFTWEYAYAGMSGPATDAHFHGASAGFSGGVVLGVPFGGPSGTFSGSTTFVGAALDSVKMLLTGVGTLDGPFLVGDITDVYLNIHSLMNLPGELRGQLFVTSVVPIPAAIWMMISGLGALVGVRRFT